MLYPQKLNRKKGESIIKTLVGSTVVVGLLLILINYITTPTIHWSYIANAGMIYTWITVLYAVNRHTNIAGYVLLQAIAISILTWFIDLNSGAKGWSINFVIPCIIIVANITMFVLTIVSHRKYIRYAIYQLLICLFSLMPLVFIVENLVFNKIMSIAALIVSVINLIVTIVLCKADVKAEMIRKFHV